MARNNQSKATKSRLLGLDSSRRKLNSSKTVDEVTYYSLADVETVIASVLSEVSSDPTVGITLSAADTGITLNCVNENGDEYTVDVDLESEDDDVASEETIEDVNSSKRHMNASRRLAAIRKKLNSSREDIVKELLEYFSPEEAEEYVDSFEEQTGAKATRLATPDEAEQYDGDFWAIKDGKESLWCRGNGYWYECNELDSSRKRMNASRARRTRSK